MIGLEHMAKDEGEMPDLYVNMLADWKSKGRTENLGDLTPQEQDELYSALRRRLAKLQQEQERV